MLSTLQERAFILSLSNLVGTPSFPGYSVSDVEQQQCFSRNLAENQASVDVATDFLQVKS